MKEHREIGMQTQLLIVLIPALFMMTILIGYTSYRALRETIISGFDRKLRAVSSVTASFIDGDLHRGLASLRQIRGLTFDPATDTLYVNHFAGHEVFALHLPTHRCRLMTVEGVGAIENITYDRESGTLWAVDNEHWRLIQIDPFTGAVRDKVEIGEPCYALAYDGERKILYGYGDRLFSFDRKNDRKLVVGKAGLSTIRGMTYLDGHGVILGVDVHENRLVHIDPSSGEVQVRGLIADSASRETTLRENPHPYRFGVFGLTYNPLRNECYGSTPVGLITIDPSRGVVGTITDFPADKEELQEIYRQYVDPMIEIRNECNLTFLYTAILDPREHHLSYVLDSTQDEAHSFIGSVDPSPSEQGIQNVWYKGNVFLSGIRHWEEWGLLKSAYVPITDRQGATTGIAGADVNISIITEKTNKALFTVFLIGFIFLGIGAVVAVVVSRRLILPMRILSQGALKAAAGSFGHQVEIRSPRELRTIAQRFNAASSSLKETLERHVTENKMLDSHYRRQGLTRLMAQRIAENARRADRKLFCRWFPEIDIADSSGCSLSEGRGVVYLAKNQGTELDTAIRLRHDVHLAYLAMLHRYGSEPERLMKVLGDLFLNQVSLQGFWDVSSMRLILQCRGEAGVLLANGDGEFRWKGCEKEESVILSGGESIIIASPAASLKNLDGYRMSTDHENMSSPHRAVETIYDQVGKGSEMFIFAMVNE